MTPEQSARAYHQSRLNTAARYLAADVDLTRDDWRESVPRELMVELIDAYKGYHAANEAFIAEAFAWHESWKALA